METADPSDKNAKAEDKAMGREARSM